MTFGAALAAMISLMACHQSAAIPDPQPAACRSSISGATLHAIAAHPAAARRASRSRRAAARVPFSPGPPPGSGYCWYFIDRSTQSPGFWDLCRGR